MLNTTEVIMSLLNLKIPVQSYEYSSEQTQNEDTGLTSGNPIIEKLNVTFKSDVLKDIGNLTKILGLAFDKNKVEKIELELFDGSRSISIINCDGALLDYEETYTRGVGLTVDLSFSVKTLEVHKAKFTKARGS